MSYLAVFLLGAFGLAAVTTAIVKPWTWSFVIRRDLDKPARNSKQPAADQ